VRNDPSGILPRTGEATIRSMEKNMKDDVINLWHSLYDQGLAKGTEGFNATQKTLYDYLDMLYCVEIGGFTGFLYNNIDKDDRMPAFIHCLSYFGLLELSQQLDYLY
jgi:hypothetical protein